MSDKDRLAVLELLQEMLSGASCADPTSECSCCASHFVEYGVLMENIKAAVAAVQQKATRRANIRLRRTARKT